MRYCSICHQQLSLCVHSALSAPSLTYLAAIKDVETQSSFRCQTWQVDHQRLVDPGCNSSNPPPPRNNAPPAPPPPRNSTNAPPTLTPDHSDLTLYQNKQRTLVLSTRGITYRDRHLMSDLLDLMPHAKKDNKLDTKHSLSIINELALLKSCNNVLFLEGRKHTDLYLWVARVGGGGSVKFLVQNVHTMAEVKLTGNCIAAGTLVNLADGTSVPIEQVQRGADVLRYQAALAQGETEGLSVGQVAAVEDKGVKECVELLFSDGRTLVCTPDHRIRTADGRWMEAQHLQRGVTEVAVGVQYADSTAGGGAADGAAGAGAGGGGGGGAGGVGVGVVGGAGAAGQWRLRTTTTLGYDLDMAAHVSHALAFARLLGYVLTDGCVYNDSKLYLGHQLDAEAVVRDVYLLTGMAKEVQHGQRTLDVVVPPALHHAFVQAGAVGGKRLNKVSRLPDFVLDPRCPVPVVREFLGGLFGGDGTTLYLMVKERSSMFAGLGFCTTRSGGTAKQQQQTLQAELYALLTRVGVDCSSDIKASFTTVAPNTLTEKGRAELQQLQSAGVKVSPRRTADTLEKGKSYSIRFAFGNSLVLPFARCVGFRYCCHKQQRLSAAVAYFRTQERVLQQFQLLSDLTSKLRSGTTIPAAAELAKRELQKQELLMPASVEWSPRTANQLQPNKKSAGVPALQQLLAMGSRGFFSEPRTKKPYSSAKRQAELRTQQSAPASPASAEVSSASCAPPAKRLRSVSAPISRGAAAAAAAGVAAAAAPARGQPPEATHSPATPQRLPNDSLVNPSVDPPQTGASRLAAIDLSDDDVKYDDETGAVIPLPSAAAAAASASVSVAASSPTSSPRSTATTVRTSTPSSSRRISFDFTSRCRSSSADSTVSSTDTSALTAAMECDDGNEDFCDDEKGDVGASSADKVTYGVHQEAKALPLFRVRLVDRRNVGPKQVYDLDVPSPQGDVGRSFVANGVVVHNCMKYSRPLLVFDPLFDTQPHLQYIRAILQSAIGVPKGHPRVKPFIDHVLAFYYVDTRVWIRHYQIIYDNTTHTNPSPPTQPTQPTIPLPTPALSNVQLVEIGPRLCLAPIRIFSGSFEGATLWESSEYVSPNELRAVMRKRKGEEYKGRVEGKERTREHKRASRMDDNEVDAVFEAEMGQEGDRADK